MDSFMGKGICTQIMCQYLVKLTSSLGAPNPIRSFTASRKVLKKKQKRRSLGQGMALNDSLFNTYTYKINPLTGWLLIAFK